jgi:hypothetical protein
VMYVEEDRLRFHYNGFGERTSVEGPLVPAGEHAAMLEYEASPSREGRGRIMLDRDVAVPWTRMAPTMVLYGVLEGLDVGLDRRGPVLWDLFERHGAFAYQGTIRDVRIEPGARVPM